MNESESHQNMENKCPQCGAPLPSGVLAGLCPACLLKQGTAADTAVPPEIPQFEPPSVAEIAKLFPQLEILALIGKGGMGAVYRARQPALDRIVALKILPPQTATGPGFVERFNREARALAKLNHPNIVAVYEFGQAAGLSYFVMEYVDGVNLRELERTRKLSPREALQIVPQICEALQFAHDEGVVHRDIKPENILLDKKGRVKIADFGIAKILSGPSEVDLTGTQGAIGTPHYMAPEQMEKPTAVDHRADIFSLGVVFYEMLTGELPLGKFAPPSARKVEVDVRLDDVVLRALEKDPELRYQQANQVKTAVDTIAGSAAPPPRSSAANAAAIAQEILARDYTLNIRSCLRRGWNLLKGDFWALMGITALVMALFAFASSFGAVTISRSAESSTQVSSLVAALIGGPLWGGLWFYYLKKIRREPTTVETAFCGFNPRWILHLFLAGFVTSILIWLGFLCLVIPGIYLAIAWMFPLQLVLDKGLDFWSAMELSRKVVTKHWFKFLGLGLVLLLLLFVGVMAFIVGIFVMMPLVMATLMYAYEDIFGGVQGTAATPAATGLAGTQIIPPVAANPLGTTARNWTRVTGIGLGVVVLAIIALAVISGLQHRHRTHRIAYRLNPPAPAMPALPPSRPAAESGEPVETPSPAIFGPVIEQELPMPTAGTNQFLNLADQRLLTPSPSIVDALPASPDEDGDRFWEALDIPQGSRPFQYISWLRENGADLMFAGNGKIIGFDGIFAMAHGNSSTNWDDWEGLNPEQARDAVAVVDWSRRAEEAASHGLTTPPAPKPGGIYHSAAQLVSREPGGPVVNVLTRDQSVNWFFKTRGGRLGVLQLAGFQGDPPVARIRYKLVQPGTNQDLEVGKDTRDLLFDRLDAASSINDFAAKDKLLSAVANDAARAGEVQIARAALQKMTDWSQRNAASREAALSLAKHGYRKQAIELAKSINDFDIRNQTLSELAQ